MAMYTGLRFKAELKKEYISIFEEMLYESWTWEEISNYYPNHPILKEMIGKYKADFIPCGHVEIMEWQEENPYGGCPFVTPSNWLSGIKNGVWTFQCSLTNNEKTIEHFLEKVAPEIAENILYAETFYEGDTEGKILVNNIAS